MPRSKGRATQGGAKARKARGESVPDMSFHVLVVAKRRHMVGCERRVTNWYSYADDSILLQRIRGNGMRKSDVVDILER